MAPTSTTPSADAAFKSQYGIVDLYVVERGFAGTLEDLQEMVDAGATPAGFVAATDSGNDIVLRWEGNPKPESTARRCSSARSASEYRRMPDGCREARGGGRGIRPSASIRLKVRGDRPTTSAAAAPSRTRGRGAPCAGAYGCRLAPSQPTSRWPYGTGAPPGCHLDTGPANGIKPPSPHQRHQGGSRPQIRSTAVGTRLRCCVRGALWAGSAGEGHQRGGHCHG